MIKITIDFTKYTSHVELIQDLSPAFNAGWGDDVYIRINLYSYSIIYSDMLAIVASTVSHLREKGVAISGSFLPFSNQRQADYASRINFFQFVGLAYEESFLRHDSSGKFTEIRKFYSEKNSTDKISVLHQDIIRILHNCQVMKEVMIVLEFCLHEVLDNTLNHSKAMNGWACCQYFKEKNEIRLIVLDTGIGIHKALTEYPESNYKDLSEEEAVFRCIEKGVTNGFGAGFGLWATSQFVRENEGKC